MAKSQKKRCSRCGAAKPRSAFHKDKGRPDGLNIYCKQCRKNGYSGERLPGIETWSQVGDVLRTMAETQAAINKENDSRKQRISLINEYSDELIQPLEDQQAGFRGMIKMFLEKNDRKAMKEFKVFRFGRAKLSRGKLEIVLQPKLASQLKGKP